MNINKIVNNKKAFFSYSIIYDCSWLIGLTVFDIFSKQCDVVVCCKSQQGIPLKKGNILKLHCF